MYSKINSNSNFIFIFYFFFILKIYFCNSYSKPFLIDDNFKIVNSIDSSNLIVLEDKDSKLNINLVIKKYNSFKKVDELEFDSKSTYWITFELINKLDIHKNLRISPGVMWMKGDIYILKKNQLIEKKTQGRSGTFNYISESDPKVNSPQQNKSQFANISLEPNEKVRLFIRLKSDRIFIPKNFNTFIYDQNSYAEYRRLGIYIEGILAGSVLALFIFFFFNWYKTKDKTTLLFSLWLVAAFFSILTTPVIDGIRFGEFLFDIGPYNFNSAVSFAHFIFMVFAFAQAMLFVVFAREFLDLKKYYPKVYLATNIYLLWYLCFFIFNVVLQPLFHVENVRLFVVFPNLVATPIILTTLLFCAYQRYKDGMEIARFFMLALFPYLIFRSLFLTMYFPVPNPLEMLPDEGIGNFFKYPGTSQLLGICLEAIIMSLSVVARITDLQKKLASTLESQKIMVEDQKISLEETVKEREQVN